MLTLGEAQEIFIDAMSALEVQQVMHTMATEAEPTYVEYWQCDSPSMQIIWYEEPGTPTMIEIETDSDLPGFLQRDLIDPEDVESVVAWLTQN